jgi:regulatory protein
MTRLLERRIRAWARRAEKAGQDPEAIAAAIIVAREAAVGVIAKLTERRFLDDASFAKNRAERLTRAGKSRRAVSAYLAQKGVDDAVARAAVPQDDATELGAAVALIRKKRLGAFSRHEEGADERELRTRWLGTLARAGFSFRTAERALRLDREEAERIMRDSR